MSTQDDLLWPEEHETRVIEAILMAGAPALYAALDEGLTGPMFFRGDYGVIFDAACEVAKKRDQFTALDVQDELSRSGKLNDDLRGKLTELALSGSHSTGVAGWAETVKRFALRRELEKAGHQIVATAREDGELDDILARADKTLTGAMMLGSAKNVDFRTRLNVHADKWKKAVADGTGFPYLSYGYSHIDNCTGGMRPQQMIVIAGRPGMGKTAFALNVAENVADTRKHVAYFSLEMSVEEMGDRMLARLGALSATALRDADSSPYRIGDYEKAQAKRDERLQYLRLDDTNRSLEEVTRETRRLKRKGELDLVVVDHLGLLVDHGKHRSLYEGVTATSNSLRWLASDLDVPIIAVHQLNRAYADRGEKNPVLSDLRDSGAIEQDAHAVLFVHRPELLSGAPDADKLRETKLIVAKARIGSTGVINFDFDGRHSRFTQGSRSQDEVE